jgi:hypothetical protein
MCVGQQALHVGGKPSFTGLRCPDFGIACGDVDGELASAGIGVGPGGASAGVTVTAISSGAVTVSVTCGGHVFSFFSYKLHWLILVFGGGFFLPPSFIK